MKVVDTKILKNQSFTNSFVYIFNIFETFFIF